MAGMQMAVFILGVMSLATLIFVLMEALKDQIGFLKGNLVFWTAILLGGLLGGLLAVAQFPGLGIDLLPGLPALWAGVMIGVLAGVLAPGLDKTLKKYKALEADGLIAAAANTPTPQVVATASGAEPEPERLEPIRPDLIQSDEL